MALLYMLHQPIAVDEKDTDGHTALMWAAWQGDAISIDLLLKHGASVDATDNSHLTPLHWATIKASRPCIDRLVSAGAKLDARDDAGKTARDMADEMKILEPYRLGLHDAGYALDGFKIQSALDPKRTQYAILLAPTVFLGAVFASIAYLPIYVGIPFAAALFFGMHHLLTRTLLGSAGFGDTVSKSPYFAAIITASLVWAILGTPNGLILNFWFALAYITCAYNFYRAITLDPGHSRLPQDEAELNSLVEDLASTGRLNGTIFCISCMLVSITTVLGYGIVTDQTCRFTVGSGNHRQFLLFVGALVAGISLFDAVAISWAGATLRDATREATLTYVAYIDYTSNAPTYVPPPSDYLEFCDVMPSLCRAYNFAPFVLAVALWSTLQLTWTIILLATQIFQVCRQMTTLEVSNLGRYGFMGGKGGSSLREQGGAMAHLMAHQSQQPSSLGAGPGQSGAEEEGLVISSNGDGDAVGDSARPLGGSNDIHVHGPGCKHNANGAAGHQHHHHRFGIVGKICSTALRACTGGPMLQLLGLDRFTKGKAIEGMRKSGQGGTGSNPFSVGLVGNCHDFWTNGGALGVDYTALYEIPSDGFHYKPGGLMATIRNRGQPGSTSRNRDYEMLPSHDNV
ncbi:hypothetical protein QFC21_001247 [Naganishia friedmannii]|uniref:Uncharacterized protein n=1 Tax=Naganishia friedmannii TaxID=89922 RepID=A0ACC2W2Z5_9TREE|nr:hypothetical protein QFC21_001247 [Naganishia friedmannii]